MTACTICKIDSTNRTVFGWSVLSSVGGRDYFDTQGHHVPEDVVLKAAVEFMAGDRPSLRQHDGEPIGRVLFAWPMTRDIAKAFGVHVDKTGLMIGVRVDDDATLTKFRDGTLTGFSIAGTADLEEVA